MDAGRFSGEQHRLGDRRGARQHDGRLGRVNADFKDRSGYTKREAGKYKAIYEALQLESNVSEFFLNSSQTSPTTFSDVLFHVFRLLAGQGGPAGSLDS